FRRVVKFCGCSMRIDVTDLLCFYLCIFERCTNATLRTCAGRLWLCHMVRIRRCSISQQFRINSGSTASGMFHLFQHQDACAFGNHKTITVLVERTACYLRLLVSCRKYPGCTEPPNPQDFNRRFSTTSQNNIADVPLDRPHCLAYGMRTCCAS